MHDRPFCSHFSSVFFWDNISQGVQFSSSIHFVSRIHHVVYSSSKAISLQMATPPVEIQRRMDFVSLAAQIGAVWILDLEFRLNDLGFVIWQILLKFGFCIRYLYVGHTDSGQQISSKNSSLYYILLYSWSSWWHLSKTSSYPHKDPHLFVFLSRSSLSLSSSHWCLSYFLMVSNNKLLPS